MNCTKNLMNLHCILLRNNISNPLYQLLIQRCFSTLNHNLRTQSLNHISRKLLSNKHLLSCTISKYSVETDKMTNKTAKSSEQKKAEIANEELSTENTDKNNVEEVSALSEEKVDEEKTPKKSKSALAKLFAEYGVTAVLFHTSLSLTSLGISYTLVSSGIDVVALLQKFNIMGDYTAVAGGTTTFIIAYACHKVFMPVRTFITISCTPLIVRRLRGMGILKTPPK